MYVVWKWIKDWYWKDNKDKPEITDTALPVKYLIPKNKKSYIDIVIWDECKLAYPNNANIKRILSGALNGKY
jgi:hypothetical protein